MRFTLILTTNIVLRMNGFFPRVPVGMLEGELTIGVKKLLTPFKDKKYFV